MKSKYKNIQIKYVHVATMIQGSPLESLWHQDFIQKSNYLTSHLRFIEFINPTKDKVHFTEVYSG